MDASAKLAWAAARPTTNHVVDTACVAPWVSIEFDPSGWVYACCTSGMYPLGRIGEDRLRDLWGGPRAQVLRNALRNDDLTVACGPCRWHLEHGRTDPVAAVYDRYPLDSPDPERPYMMLFALSNRCNLGCIMCTPELSSTLRRHAGLEPLPSRYDDEFFADLAPLLGELRLAKFLGGEPFLAPEHKRVWQLMDALERPPRMQVTTNGTIWTSYVEWLLSRFEVDISISLDAHTAPTYEAIRAGGDHAEVLRNVDRFAEACRARGTELHVSYCLMNRNWTELGDFLAWAERFDVPASINLVTDDGLALHDADLDALLAIRHGWERDEARLAGRLQQNAGVWATQLAQLESVISERRAGVRPAPRQSRPATPDFFELPAHRAPPRRRRWLRSPVGHGGDTVRREHVARLEAWSGGGPVAIIELDLSGRIVSVPEEHPRLGLMAQDLLGLPLDGIVPVMQAALGRPVWIVDFAEQPEHTVRTMVVSTERPVRGTRGTIVRTVQLATESGWTVLAAEDRIYDVREVDPPRGTGTPASATPVVIGRSASS